NRHVDDDISLSGNSQWSVWRSLLLLQAPAAVRRTEPGARICDSACADALLVQQQLAAADAVLPAADTGAGAGNRPCGKRQCPLDRSGFLQPAAIGDGQVVHRDLSRRIHGKTL